MRRLERTHKERQVASTVNALDGQVLCVWLGLGTWNFCVSKVYATYLCGYVRLYLPVDFVLVRLDGQEVATSEEQGSVTSRTT